MLSKIKSKFSQKNNSQDNNSEDKSIEVSNKISNGISELIDQVVTERKNYYENNPAPTLESLNGIISSCANKNAVISGGVGLIPGPWGMVAAIPEILAVVRNQLMMVYDISKAHGQDIGKEVLISILFGAIGNGATSLLVVQGQKVMAKRVGASALQSLIKALGGKITQQLAKSMAAKWLPVAGAIAMATWSRYSTKKIGQKALTIFTEALDNKENDPISLDSGDFIDIESNQLSSSAIDEVKILTMINLMKIDGVINDVEVEFIHNFIEKSDFTSSKKIELIGVMKSADKIMPNYGILNGEPDEKLYLLIDLISLAKIDGNFDITEKMFVKEIGRLLSFDKSDIEELIA